MNKLFWITLPIILLAAYVLIRLFTKRPISRFSLNIITALYLFVYFFATASLGLFWVARMDLPVFDLHFLFGYCVLLLMGIHVWLQLPVLNAWFKKGSPQLLLEPDRRRWRKSVRVAGLIIFILIGATLAGILVYEFIRPSPTRILYDEGTFLNKNPKSVVLLASTMTENDFQDDERPKRTWLLHDGKRIDAATYIHYQSSLSRWGVFRRPRFAVRQPPEFKSFPGKQIIELPVPRKTSGKNIDEVLARLKGSPPSTRNRLSQQDISDLLHYSYGVTEVRRYPGGTIGLRAAASAGALYPTDIYLAVQSVDGLQAGLYYYHAEHHHLVKIDDETTLQRIALASGYHGWLVNSPLTVILTTVFDRTVWKYGERSYRYVVLDAGHVAGNLTLTATALGWNYRLVGLLADRQLGDALGLNPSDEGALLIVAFGDHKMAPEMKTPAFDIPSLPKNIDDIEITRLAHLFTSLQWKRGTVPHRIMPAIADEEVKLIPGESISLPQGTAHKADVFHVIQSRRSFREFSNREITFESFAGLLNDCWQPVKHSLIVETGRRTNLFAVVRKVSGLQGGIYKFLPEKNILQLTKVGNFSDEIYKAGLSQELLERAAVVLVWTIDMNQIGKLHGDRDYRYALLEVGISGEVAYLAAVARGLGACGVGAFYDDEVEKVLGVEKTSNRAVYLVGIGRR